MSTSFDTAEKLADILQGATQGKLKNGVTWKLTEGDDGTQIFQTDPSAKKAVNLAFQPLADQQWNINIGGNADNAFHFYRDKAAYVDEAYAVSTDATGPDVLSLGAGNDTVYGISVASDKTTVKGGDGTNQYLYGGTDVERPDVAAGEAPAREVKIVDGSGSSYAEVTGTWTAEMGLGADLVSVVTDGNEGAFTWTDYNAAEGDILQVDDGKLDVKRKADGTNYEELERALHANGVIDLGLKANGTSEIQAVLNTEGKSNYRALLRNVDGENVATDVDVWYAGTKGTTINAEPMDTSVIMISNNNENEGDSLLGGAKGDILIGGMNDTLNGGVGDDTVYLGTSNLNVGVDGQRETVVLDTRGDKDTVYNFETGFADTSDVIHVARDFGSIASITSDGTDVTATLSDGSNLTIKDVGQNQTTHMQDFLVSNGDAIKTVTVVQTDKVGYVDDSDKYDAYFGNNSILDFSKSTGVDFNIAVDLGNTGKFGAHSEYHGITQVYGMNADNNTLVGAAGANNTLAAGANSYHNSIWGGGLGRDYIVADDGAVDSIFYGEGDDMDTVTGFNVSEDRIYAHSGKVVGTERTSQNSDVIRFTWNDNNAFTVVANSKDADTALQYTQDGVTNRGVKVGISDQVNTFTYEDTVGAYYGGSSTDTLNVSTSENAKIWLDGSRSKAFQSIEVVNAQGSTGNLELAGDSGKNLIYGGAGQNSIWGGLGAADTMVGGSGKNTFYFGVEDGNDLIMNYNDGDKVMLYNVSTSGIASAALSGGNMVIELKDGSKLTIANYSGNGSMSFQLTDGTYNYDKDSNTWVQA